MTEARACRMLALLLAGLIVQPASVIAQSTSWQTATDASRKAEDEGRYAEAERMSQSAIAAARPFGTNDPRLARSYNHLARVLSKEGRYAEALPLVRWALAVSEKNRGPQDQDVAACLGTQAAIFHGLGRDAEAEPLYRRALEIYRKAVPIEPPGATPGADTSDTTFHREGSRTTAESPEERPSSGSNASLPTGRCHKARMHLSEPQPQQMRPVTIREKASPGANSDAEEVLGAYASLLRKTGRGAEAEKVEAYAKGLRAGAR
jgi:tetratricopeptide (TPR) repeat protein